MCKLVANPVEVILPELVEVELLDDQKVSVVITVVNKVARDKWYHPVVEQFLEGFITIEGLVNPLFVVGSHRGGQSGE